MSNLKLYSLVLATFLLISGCANTAPTLKGTWKITREAGASPISALSNEEVQSTIGTLVTVSDQALEFGKMKCINPKIQTSKTSVQQFFDDYRIERLDNLGSAAHTIEINCDKGTSINPLLLNGEAFLFVLDGVLFEVQRLK